MAAAAKQMMISEGGYENYHRILDFGGPKFLKEKKKNRGKT